MSKLPLLEALLKYHNEGNLIMSMPGNKSGLAFERDNIGKTFKENLGSLDITEVTPLDNLHNPEGVIKEAQELLKKHYKCKKAYFLVNGSSSGNLASIFAAFNEYDEVLVERNCHKSVFNALILRKLKVTYIEPKVLDNGLFIPPGEKEIYKALKNAKNPKGIILTSPNYYGISYNLEEIIKDLKSKGLKVIIDQAHGAHFGVSKDLPKSLGNLGDYVVVSAHKTIPALTGGSYLLVNDTKSNIEFYLKCFMTTSPSYLIMASLDYGRYYMDTYGKEDYEKLITLAQKYKNKINKLHKVKIISDCDLPENYTIDKSRYLITLKEGFSGHKLLDYFRKNKIQCEMSTSFAVVMILSPCYGEDAFIKIYNAIKELDINILKDNNTLYKKVNTIPEKVLEPYEVFNKEGEYIDIFKSEGKIAKEAIVPYPPGVPLIMSGEKINKEIIDYLYKKGQKTILAVKK